MIAARQTARLRRNPKVECFPIHARTKDGIMPINSCAERQKRPFFCPLGVDPLNRQSPMNPTIKCTGLVGDFKPFFDMQSAVPVCLDLRIESEDSIRSLRSS